MALLKDTLIQGSARITDTLYTNNININDILSTKKLIISSTTAEEHIQFSRTDNINYILFPNSANTGIGIGYAVGVAYCPLIIQKTSIYPGATVTLGTTSNRWNGIYGTTGSFNSALTADTITISNTTPVAHLTFLRENWNYIKIPDNNNAVLAIGTNIGDSDVQKLVIHKTGTVRPGGNNTQDLGNSSHQWKNIYGRVLVGDTVKIQTYDSTNSSISTVVEFDGLSLLPGIATAYAGRTIGSSTRPWPNIYATTFTGTLSGNATNVTGTVAVGNGGTGATTFTSDCVIVGNGTNAMESRGLKVTGATDANVVVQAYTSDKGLTIQSPGGAAAISITTAANSGTGALALTSGGNMSITSSSEKTLTLSGGSTVSIIKPSIASIVFYTNGNTNSNSEVGRFNLSGMFQLNSNVTQSTHKLLVNGDSAFTGKLAFIDTPAATLTEKVYIQQANNAIQLVAKAINFPTITDGTGIVGSDLGANANPRYRPASWKYNAGITPIDGDIVTVKIPSGANDYGTWLSLDNGSTYYPIIHSNGSRLQNWFSSNMSITLRYDSLATCSVYGAVSSGSIVATNSRATVTGCWRLITQYDTGNDGRWYVRYYTTKAYQAVTASHVIGGTSNGYTNVDGSTDAAFDIRYPVLFTGSNIAANATDNNVFTFHYAVNLKNSSGNNITFPAHAPLYIKGTISGYTFTPISGGNPFVSEITEADDGYVYYYIGKSYATTAMSFDTTARKILWYKNGIICDYTGLNNVSNNSALNNIAGTVGDIIYWSAANTPAHLAKGTAGKFLKMGNNNVPIWGDGSEVTLNGTATTTPSFYAPADSGTANYLLKSGGPSAAPIWDTNVSVTAGGMLSATQVKAPNGFWVNDNYQKGNTTQRIKEALICVDSSNLNYGSVVYEYNANSAISRFGLYTYANIANNTTTNTYFTLEITDDGETKRTQTDAKIYGAVWNDYAEYRKQLYEIEPGRVVRDLNSGHVVLTEERLIPGAQVVSDTFGFAIGETKECKTPLAVSGRVLVFTTQDRYKYNAGDAVCSGPHGTVDIMTREEIQKYPDAIVGIVSEIPTYDTWGQNEVAVQGRIWIKVR